MGHTLIFRLHSYGESYFRGARFHASFGDLGSLQETSLGLLKVDDAPNRAEVLRERVD
jgi:hypothetical protein